MDCTIKRALLDIDSFDLIDEKTRYTIATGSKIDMQELSLAISKVTTRKKNWDTWFLDVCEAVAQNSTCFSRKIGAIIVDPDKNIIATGYNGPPRGVDHCENRYFKDDYLIAAIKKMWEKKGKKIKRLWIDKDAEDVSPVHMSYQEYIEAILRYFSDSIRQCPRQFLEFKSGEGLDFCIAGHAEENAIVNAARKGVTTKGSICYLSGNITPCHKCLIMLINAGIKEVVLRKKEYYLDNIKYMEKESGIKIREAKIEG